MSNLSINEIVRKEILYSEIYEIADFFLYPLFIIFGLYLKVSIFGIYHYFLYALLIFLSVYFFILTFKYNLVYFEKYNSKNNNNSLFKENVFTFHADRGRLNYKVSINDNDVDYPDTANYIQPASGTNDEAAFNNGNGEYDYYLPNNPNNIIESVDDKIGYNDKLLKFVGNTGYYDLKVKVEYSATNGQNAEISNVIVSVKPSHLKAFIKIYEDDLTERYESGFINHSAEPTYLVSSDTNHEFSTNITVNYDDKLFNNGTYSFKDIIDSLSEGEALINHVTQKPITENDFPMNIDKSYIFYIGTIE